MNIQFNKSYEKVKKNFENIFFYQTEKFHHF